jgi:hypothetical protein
MSYVSTWERLSEALKRVQSEGGGGQDEVQTDICQAIADGTIQIRCKLGMQTPGGFRASNVLQGSAFDIPATLKPESMDWEASRPKGPWVVYRGAFRVLGFWALEWIELSKTDVTNVLCAAEQSNPAPVASTKTRATSRGQPTLERALRMLKELYPDGTPGQAALPNKILCGQIQKKLKEQGLPTVSDDTILRAAGRRR